MTTGAITKTKQKRSVKSILPILAWLPNYQAGWIRLDAIAALTVWALLVPEAMAYAGIAGMPPQAGLYAAPLALLGYAIFGTSKHLNVGPSSTVAALSFSVVAGFGIVAASAEWITLTVLLAILAGAILVIAGLLRLGVLADFLSRPVLDGFIVGLAITIVVGQLDKILGYEPNIPEGLFAKFIPEVLYLALDINNIVWPIFIVGVLSLVALFVIEAKVPKLPGALTVVVGAIVLSWLLNFEEWGVHIVGEIPAGLPPFAIPDFVDPATVLALLPGALAIALVGFAESVAAARSYATKFGYRVDADQEMIALGVSNMGAAFSQGFTVDGSLSKTAASVEAGASSQMVSIIAAIAVLITAAFLTPLFYYLPEATLGAIVIHAVWHLINFHKLSRFYRVNRLDFVSGVTALVGVVAFGMLQGLLLAVVVALVGLLIGTKQRSTHILGQVPNGDSFHALENYPNSRTYPGILLLRFDGSLFFANIPDFVDEVRTAISLTEPTPSVVLVDCESINGIDVTAVEMLGELVDELNKRDISLRFARTRAIVRQVMHADGFEEQIGAEHFYLSVKDGVQAFLQETDASPSTREQGTGST